MERSKSFKEIKGSFRIECEICLNRYDHSKYLPQLISPCMHVACFACLVKTEFCPHCLNKFTSKQTSWKLVELIPESNYDKLKLNLKQLIEDIAKYKTEFSLEHNKQIDKNIFKMNQLRNDISEASARLTEQIRLNKKKLLEETKNLESFLIGKLNQIKIDDLKNLNKIELSLDNNEFNEDELDKLNNEYYVHKLNIIGQIKKLESFNNNYELKLFENKTRQTGEYGEIMNEDWPKEPHTEEDLTLKGEVLLEQLKEYKSAIECFNQVIANINPNSFRAFNGKGNVLYEMKQYDTAIKCFNQAIKLEPNYVKAYNNKGNCLFAVKKYQHALRQYAKAISLDPQYVHAYNGKGNVHMELKQYEQASDCFKKAIDIDPYYTCAYNGLANACLKSNEIDNAIDYYNKALELDSRFVHALNGKGNALKEKKEFDLAIECFNKVINLCPTYMSAYHGIGDVYREKKEFNLAIENYQKAVEINTDYVDSYYNMGLAYFEKMDFKNAFRCFDRAVEVDSKLKFNINISCS